MNKARALALFERCGLAVLPTRTFAAGHPPSASALAGAFGGGTRLMLRTSAEHEVRNLPRAAGLPPADAATWIAALPPELTVLVQTWDEVVFSVELAVFDGMVLAEIVPGVWELGTNIEPVTLTLHDDGRQTLSWTDRPQRATFHDHERGRHERDAVVTDTQLALVADWVVAHAGRLRALDPALPPPFGLKIHWGARHGFLPQNLRSAVPPLADSVGSSAPDLDAVRISATDADVPPGRPVVLDVSVAREDHSRLTALVTRLAAIGCPTVYVRSGLLSHLAIALREAGLDVRAYRTGTAPS